MSRSSTRRLGTAAVAVLAGLALVATAGPAQAATKSSFKSSGRSVILDWLEVGTLPNVDGNIHFGFMHVTETSKGRADAWGEVIDVTCPDGVVPDYPPHGGGHGEEPGEPDEFGCTFEGVRWIEGGALTLTMDNKFSSAVLGGRLNVYGHDGPAGNPPVNIRIDGVGGTFRQTDSGSYRDANESFSYTYTLNGRNGQVADESRIGPMIFDDAEGEYSNAQLGSFRETSRSRSR